MVGGKFEKVECFRIKIAKTNCHTESFRVFETWNKRKEIFGIRNLGRSDGDIFFGSDVTWLSFYCIKVFFELKAKIIFQLTFCNKTNDAVNEII